MAKAAANDEPAPTLFQQLMLFGAEQLKAQAQTDPRIIDIASAALQDDGRAISFLHRGFAHAGLPLRRPSNDMRPWVRSDGAFTLTVTGTEFAYADDRMVRVGVPYGTKARLLMLYLASEVKRPGRDPDDRWIEMGRISEWLRSVGIEPTGGPRGSLVATKEQLMRLAFAQFSMAMRAPSFDDKVWFSSERIIEAGCFSVNDFICWEAGNVSSIGWPQALRLTTNAHARLVRQSIPVSTARIKLISESATALDLFCWLCYRAPKLAQHEVLHVGWSDLMRQFGQATRPSDFKKSFDTGIRLALAAYPEARVQVVEDGLILRQSDPVIPSTTPLRLAKG